MDGVNPDLGAAGRVAGRDDSTPQEEGRLIAGLGRLVGPSVSAQVRTTDAGAVPCAPTVSLFRRRTAAAARSSYEDAPTLERTTPATDTPPTAPPTRAEP